MGRKPVFEVAMTAAQRQQRHRDKLREEKAARFRVAVGDVLATWRAKAKKPPRLRLVESK